MPWKTYRKLLQSESTFNGYTQYFCQLRSQRLQAGSANRQLNFFGAEGKLRQISFYLQHVIYALLFESIQRSAFPCRHAQCQRQQAVHCICLNNFQIQETHFVHHCMHGPLRSNHDGKFVPFRMPYNSNHSAAAVTRASDRCWDFELSFLFLLLLSLPLQSPGHRLSWLPRCSLFLPLAPRISFATSPLLI